ncbi:hypothetical protein HBN50_01640 [Halobacteriovorax sp. GB3]|uniref:hypothetical protein n=1 Tax=Halobacteriovorax sp. GB3 TaxID=2719615 RepID=UPI00235E04FF|nr:hypothetical protein [Halobacteriovorax sp. GB3]MDD0851772.1 hypothetical protein [Halobacteriovorax sp. GB3]
MNLYKLNLFPLLLISLMLFSLESMSFYLNDEHEYICMGAKNKKLREVEVSYCVKEPVYENKEASDELTENVFKSVVNYKEATFQRYCADYRKERAVSLEVFSKDKSDSFQYKGCHCNFASRGKARSYCRETNNDSKMYYDAFTLSKIQYLILLNESDQCQLTKSFTCQNKEEMESIYNSYTVDKSFSFSTLINSSLTKNDKKVCRDIQANLEGLCSLNRESTTKEILPLFSEAELVPFSRENVTNYTKLYTALKKASKFSCFLNKVPIKKSENLRKLQEMRNKENEKFRVLQITNHSNRSAPTLSNIEMERRSEKLVSASQVLEVSEEIVEEVSEIIEEGNYTRSNAPKKILRLESRLKKLLGYDDIDVFNDDPELIMTKAYLVSNDKMIEESIKRVDKMTDDIQKLKKKKPVAKAKKKVAVPKKSVAGSSKNSSSPSRVSAPRKTYEVGTHDVQAPVSYEPVNEVQYEFQEFDADNKIVDLKSSTNKGDSPSSSDTGAVENTRAPSSVAGISSSASAGAKAKRSASGLNNALSSVQGSRGPLSLSSTRAPISRSYLAENEKRESNILKEDEDVNLKIIFLENKKILRVYEKDEESYDLKDEMDVKRFVEKSPELTEKVKEEGMKYFKKYAYKDLVRLLEQSK